MVISRWRIYYYNIVTVARRIIYVFNGSSVSLLAVLAPRRRGFSRPGVNGFHITAGMCSYVRYHETEKKRFLERFLEGGVLLTVPLQSAAAWRVKISVSAIQVANHGPGTYYNLQMYKCIRITLTSRTTDPQDFMTKWCKENARDYLSSTAVTYFRPDIII